MAANEILNNVTKETNERIEAMNRKNPVAYDHPEFEGKEVIKWQESPFKSLGKIMRTTNAELSSAICQRFRKTFHDLKGVDIQFDGNGHFITSLFFEKNNDEVANGEIRNLVSLIDTSNVAKGNLYERQQVVNNRISAKTFTLNNETKELLAKFMYGGKEANMPNQKVWRSDRIINEVHVKNQPAPYMYRNGYNTERVLIKVNGFDLNIILQELYGRTMTIETVAEVDGDVNKTSQCAYEARFIKYLPNGTFVMHIEQFDKVATQEFVAKENPVQTPLGVQMFS